MFVEINSIEQHENSPVVIHVGHGDCLHHSLWMLPHQSTIHGTKRWVDLLFPTEDVSWAEGKDYYPLAIALVQVVHGINKTSCIVHRTVLGKRPVSYMTWQIVVEGLAYTHLTNPHLQFASAATSVYQWCECNYPLDFVVLCKYMSVGTPLIWIPTTVLPWCYSSISIKRAEHEINMSVLCINKL
jgi:hypothetical protein